MALIPAHLMRSVAGGYDNESVAFAIIVSTFYFWVRSLRDKQSVCMNNSDNISSKFITLSILQNT